MKNHHISSLCLLVMCLPIAIFLFPQKIREMEYGPSAKPGYVVIGPFYILDIGKDHLYVQLDIPNSINWKDPIWQNSIQVSSHTWMFD